MDSRLLYSTASYLDTIISWDKDWIYFGTNEEMQLDLIIGLVDDFFKDEYINLVHKRGNSRCCKKARIMEEIKNLLGHENFQLWNMPLDKVIKFNRIGVLLIGRK